MTMTHDNSYSPPGMTRPAASRGDRVNSASDPGRMWPNNTEERAAVPNLLGRAARTLLGLLGRPRIPARTEAEPELFVTLPPGSEAALDAADDALTTMLARAREALFAAFAAIDGSSEASDEIAAGQAAAACMDAALDGLAAVAAIRSAAHRPIRRAEFDLLAGRLAAALAAVGAALPVVGAALH